MLKTAATEAQVRVAHRGDQCESAGTAQELWAAAGGEAAGTSAWRNEWRESMKAKKKSYGEMVIIRDIESCS